MSGYFSKIILNLWRCQSEFVQRHKDNKYGANERRSVRQKNLELRQSRLTRLIARFQFRTLEIGLFNHETLRPFSATPLNFFKKMMDFFPALLS
jgi:hypothetical protein